MESIQETKFNVHQVELGQFNRKSRTLPELFAAKSDGNKQRIKAFSSHDKLYGSGTNGLFITLTINISG